jgi:hypothetical protein
MQGLAAGFWWVNVLVCAYSTFYWARQRRNDGTPGLMTPGGQVWAWQLLFCVIVFALEISPWHLLWLGLISIVLSIIVSHVWRGKMLAARYPDITGNEITPNKSQIENQGQAMDGQPYSLGGKVNVQSEKLIFCSDHGEETNPLGDNQDLPGARRPKTTAHV